MPLGVLEARMWSVSVVVGVGVPLRARTVLEMVHLDGRARWRVEGSLNRKKHAKILKSNETFVRLTFALVMASAMTRSTSSVKPVPLLKKVLGDWTMSRHRCVSACA